MQTVRIGQAVVLMLIVALVTSCSASKEYTSKLFAPRATVAQDSQAVALRFLELDHIEPDQANWVTTDIIMGRDTNKTTALDNFAAVFPATPVPVQTDMVNSQADKPLVVKADSATSDAIVRSKDKKTAAQKTVTVETKPEVKPEVIESEPVARNLNTGEVREKRSRND